MDNIQQLRDKAAAVLIGEKKQHIIDAVNNAVRQLEGAEKQRASWIGQLQAAEAAVARANGEVKDAEQAIENAAAKLEKEIQKASLP